MNDERVPELVVTYIDLIERWRDTSVTAVIACGRLTDSIWDTAWEHADTPRGESELTALLEHSIPAVRYYAAACLASGGDRDARSVLEALRDADDECALSALTTLMVLDHSPDFAWRTSTLASSSTAPVRPEIEAAATFHGFAMNGGAMHAVDVDREGAIRAVVGFRRAGLIEIADLIEAAIGVGQAIDNAAEAALDVRYAELALDEVVFRALEGV